MRHIDTLNFGTSEETNATCNKPLTEANERIYTTKLFTLVAEELEAKQIDKGLWAQSKAMKGDVEGNYYTLRVQQMKDSDALAIEAANKREQHMIKARQHQAEQQVKIDRVVALFIVKMNRAFELTAAGSELKMYRLKRKRAIEEMFVPNSLKDLCDDIGYNWRKHWLTESGTLTNRFGMFAEQQHRRWCNNEQHAVQQLQEIYIRNKLDKLGLRKDK